MTGDGKPICLVGPLEEGSAGLVLRIPLDVGGAELAPLAEGIGEIEADVLCVRIPQWLAAKFEMQVGNLVQVDNQNGKLTVSPFREGI